MEQPRRILNGRFFRVQLDSATQVMMVVRTTAVFATTAEMEEAFGEVCEVLDRGGRAGPLFIDLRAARGRNDEPFEAVMRKYRPRLITGYGPVAILVRSLVGALQIQRHFRESGGESVEIVVSSDLQVICEALGLERPPAGLSSLAEGAG